MGLIKNELAIVTVEELLQLNLAIPYYQRPYNWSTTSAHTLWQDMYAAFEENLAEYRLGSVILHKKNDKYHIVDGQQRLTTLALLLYCLGEEKKNIQLLSEQYSMRSANAIITNFELLTKKANELEKDVGNRFKDYLLTNCTVVKIVTDEEQEAFQFFDSQNARGRALTPHDLLKSYHLREMAEEDEELKTKIIERWEDQEQQKLATLFKGYLYPLTQWYKWRDGLGYSSKKIAVFKGIKSSNTYHYALYQKAANLFVEQMNRNGSVEMFAVNVLNQFQLTQPLIAGKRFFNYTLHYAGLHEKVKKRITDFHTKEQIPTRGAGDRYIKQLYENVLLFFADRFGLNMLTDGVLNQLYTWSYSLRLTMYAVYPETINKYAIGTHPRINNGIDLFAKISEMHEPEELNVIVLQKVDPNETRVQNNIKKYPQVWNFLRDENRW